MRRILPLILLIITIAANAQERYLNQIFTSVNVQTVLYGRNFTVIAVPQIGHTVETGAIGQPLAADVYTPAGDTETKRPLVLYFHTGNFLPFPQNTSASGTRKDSTCVDFVTKFAKMGYVAASVDYRLGWNPIASTQEGRVNTLINAAYRGVQDARTAIRYFKKNADLFGIDTTKILLFGQGTGGYITLATASLDKYSEVLTTTNGQGKFIGSNGFPYVIEKVPFPPSPTGVLYINGDIEGKVTGFVPPNSDGTPNPGPPPTGDTLCYPNHVNHTSDFAMAVNMGGALGDISWLDANTPPIVSIHCPYDLFAPYEDAVLNVPIPGGQLPVVRVQGSLLVQQVMDGLGKNDAFLQLDPAKDPIGTAIKSKQGGHTNLFPLFGTNLPLDSSPWDFWSTSNPNHTSSLQTNPDMTPEKGRKYIDSILMYVAPRACIGLDLPCKTYVTTSTKDLTDGDVSLTLAPNPASNQIKIEVSKDTPVKSISVLDLSGRLVNKVSNVNTNVYQLQRNGLQSGMYILKLEFESGILNKKIMFN